MQGAKKDAQGEVTVTNQEAFLVTQWLERGVFHALENEYLSCISFAIYSREAKTNSDVLLESYEFKISYSSDGKVAKINDVDITSKEVVKTQAAKLIRSLTEFTATLDELPKTRWITVELKAS